MENRECSFPLIDLGGHPYTLEHLDGVCVTCACTLVLTHSLSVRMTTWSLLCHGSTGRLALSAVMEHSGRITLATTVTLVVVLDPVAVAQEPWLVIDLPKGGRLLVGAAGPGFPHARTIRAVGIDFAERWQRFDEAIGALRAIAGGPTEPTPLRRGLLFDGGCLFAARPA